jgi:hypothetical protein
MFGRWLDIPIVGGDTLSFLFSISRLLQTRILEFDSR